MRRKVEEGGTEVGGREKDKELYSTYKYVLLLYMSSFDLDISNYSINDIEKFFKLDNMGKYTTKDVELKEYEIRTQLFGSNNVPKEMKRDIVVFSTAAKQWLLYTKFGENAVNAANVKNNDEFQRMPTTVPKYQNRLDESSIPLALTHEISRKDNELIYQDGKPFIYTHPTEYYKGNMNPLNTRIVSKCLSIDTKHRDNYETTTSSDFYIQLPSKINKVVSMQLSKFDLPVVFYNISETFGNNFFYLYVNKQEYLNGPVEEFTTVITIPDGMYTASSLMQHLNRAIAPRDASGILIGDRDSIFSYIRFHIDLDDQMNGTGKCIVEASGIKAYLVNSIGLDFRRNAQGNPDNVDIKTRMGWNLGFRKPVYSGKTTYYSDTTIDTRTTKYVYLAIDDYQKSVNNLFLDAFNANTMNENILARISITTEDFDTVIENNLNIISEPRQYFGPVDLQRLRVRLFDDHGRQLNMNNADFAFVLNLKTVYDI